MRPVLSTLLIVVLATLMVAVAAFAFTGCKTTKCPTCPAYDGAGKRK